MKKFTILLAAIALGCFSVPALAVDWNFYGSARMATFYTDTDFGDLGQTAGGDEVLNADGLELDPASHRVRGSGQDIQLGPREFKLLEFFMSHPERVYSRSQLLDRVWGANVYVEERTVDVHIRRLRKALEPGSFDRFVQTVRGAGYRFSTRVS